MQGCARSFELTPFDNMYSYFTDSGVFYDNNRKVNEEQYFKVYNDGGHYVASVLKKYQSVLPRKKMKSKLDYFFDYVYFTAIKSGVLRKNMFEFVKDTIIDEFGQIDDIDNYVQTGIDRKISNLHKRLKLFRRKARLNKWTHFVTITYDNKKHDAISFRQKLKRTLSNFHTRRGWKYMGVFEYAPETKRLHFHALMYIPKDEMVGQIEECKDYSTAQHKMQITHQNTFFADAFGRNDFAQLSEFEVKNGNAIDYITKYISKTNEKILYSRGIPDCVILKLHHSDVATVMQDFVLKFVLFDDVIDYERDILHIRYKYRQQTLYDYGIAV